MVNNNQKQNYLEIVEINVNNIVNNAKPITEYSLTHNKSKMVYMCDECKDLVDTKQELKTHIIYHHGENLSDKVLDIKPIDQTNYLRDSNIELLSSDLDFFTYVKCQLCDQFISTPNNVNGDMSKHLYDKHGSELGQKVLTAYLDPWADQ